MKALFEKITWKTIASTVDIYIIQVSANGCSFCSRSIYRGHNWSGSTPAVKIEGRVNEEAVSHRLQCLTSEVEQHKGYMAGHLQNVHAVSH